MTVYTGEASVNSESSPRSEYSIRNTTVFLMLIFTVPSAFNGGISEPLPLLQIVVVLMPPGCILDHFPSSSFVGRGLRITLTGLILATDLEYVDLSWANILTRRDLIGGRQAHTMAKLISMIVHIVEEMSYVVSVLRYWISSVVTRKTELSTTLDRRRSVSNDLSGIESTFGEGEADSHGAKPECEHDRGPLRARYLEAINGLHRQDQDDEVRRYGHGGVHVPETSVVEACLFLDGFVKRRRYRIALEYRGQSDGDAEAGNVPEQTDACISEPLNGTTEDSEI